MIRNNQNGRRRGRGGARPPQADGGGAPRGNNNYNNGGGNRLELRQRGNATQLLEKYKALARDAAQNGDRVATEYYMQHADHYYRLLNDYRERQPDARQQPRRDYDDDDSGEGQNYNNGQSGPQNYTAQQHDVGSYDDDGDEGEAAPARNGEQDGNRMSQPRQDQQGRPEQQSRQDAPRQQSEQQPRRDDYRQQNGQSTGQSNGGRSGERQDNARLGNDRQDGGRQAQERHPEYQPNERQAGERAGNERANGQRHGGERHESNRQDSNRQDSNRHDNNRQDGAAPAHERTARRSSHGEPPAGRVTAQTEAAKPLVAEEQPLFAGIPGPATRPAEAASPALSPAPADVPRAAPVDAADFAGEPVAVPRKRGRPRKIVEVAAES